MLSCVRVVSWTRSCRVRKHSELGCSGTNKTEGTEECEGDKCTRGRYGGMGRGSVVNVK